jgi:hypothetical protein
MSYLPGVSVLLIVIAPVLVPLFITGAHTVANWRRRPLTGAMEHMT